ncbi:hypothetical protein K439DRAFT_225551 [Ramaria rubella]|nr:hypothetical protein K439DRAFT_225551 [Ramaria rubella]
MSFPYSSYTELASPFGAYYDDVPTLADAELEGTQLIHDNAASHMLRSYPPMRSYSADQSLYSSCPPANQHCMFDELSTMSPVIWDSPSEQDAYLNGSLIHGFAPSDLAFSPEAFSTGHHVSYNPDNSYTRMFRGRKSKSASEVLDELRPYACDICQAAFARSHDRDRHKRSHTGETPYRCHGCGTGFKRPDARKRHWERDPVCAQEDWLRVRHTPEGAKRRARAKTKPVKKQIEI